MACPCSPLRGSSFEFIYSVPGGPIPVGWCATHGVAVRGHVREQGRSVDGAADHWPANLEGGASRRQAGRHTRVASAHAAQSCYARRNTCDWRRTVAARGRANHHLLHEDHPAGYSGRIGHARRREERKKDSRSPKSTCLTFEVEVV